MVLGGARRRGAGRTVGSKLISADRLHAKWMKDPEYRKAYDRLEAEYARASAMIEKQDRPGRSRGPRGGSRSRKKPSR
jgi:hypothetical protein